MGEPLFFASADEFREWMQEHHQKDIEVTVGYYRKGASRQGMDYASSVDVALCFGWIDGVRHRIDEERYQNRFTPRRKGSKWSRVNIKRFAELRERGLVTPAGLAAFEAWDGSAAGYSFEGAPESLPPEYERQLRADPAAWEYWQSRPPGYRRRASHWVMEAKRPETRERRLQALIDDSAAGQAIKLLRRNNPGGEG